MSDPVTTETQVSAGGVAFRWQGERVEVALISVGDLRRWQLPKGLVIEGETHEQAALREVNEEAGLTAHLIRPLDRVEYWFVSNRDGRRIRIHKFVHFFLMQYISGKVEDHDHEVNEARWFEIGKALEMLTFDSDRKIVRMAQQHIQELG